MFWDQKIYFDISVGWDTNRLWDIGSCLTFVISFLCSSSTHTSSVTLLGLPSATTEFTMRFTRKYSYYLLNMLLPVLFLNALGIFVFILPAESGEKISYSLTILLSLSVVMTLVSDNIPPTSTHTCLLSKFLPMGVYDWAIRVSWFDS